MRNLLRNLKPYWKTVILLIALLMVQAYCDMALPQYTQDIIDTGIQNKGIEHILPERQPADEYRAVQIFMTKGEKKEWQSIYEKSGTYYKLKVTDEKRLEKLDEKFMTPVVLTYQLGHTSVKNFKQTVKRSLKQNGFGAAGSSGANGTAGSSGAVAGNGTAGRSSFAAGTRGSAMTPARQKAMAEAREKAQKKAQEEMLKKIDAMSLSEMEKTFHMDIRSFRAKDENGRMKTYVDMRSIMGDMIRKGTMDDAQIRKAKRQMQKTIDSVGSETLKAMGIRYAAECNKAAGINVNRMQKSYLWRCGGRMFAMALLMMLAASMVSFFASRVGANVGRDLRRGMFRNVMAYSNAEMDQFSTSSLITRCTNDVQQVQMVSTMMLRMVLYAPIMGVWGIVKVANTHAHMSWVILAGVGAIVFLVLILMALALPKFKIMQTLVDKLNGVSREILTGLPVIRAFGREKTEEERFDRANVELKKTQLFTNRVMTFMQPSMMLVMFSLSVLITWVAAHRINDGTMQVGAMTAFITYSMMIVMAFMMITVMSIILPRAGVAADRIHEVLMTETSIVEKADAEAVETKQGRIEFRHVGFRYPGAEDNVLTDIDFTAEPGQTTAIIGSTGSGKSTMVNLIPRFYDVTEGEILLDGRDIRDLKLASLREEIGFVPQKGILFSGTIASNLRFGRPDATDEEIRRAAEIAQASEFIDEKEEGYDSYIAQGGNNVSGGQKQRLSIARAIAKKPALFVFDDSFSALDMKTDAKLRKVLAEEEKQATKIIVAQRISTILHAEQIIVLDEGRIVGKGTHEELMRSCEVYREIAQSQLSKSELEAV
ncbi:ATP-binding cassette, subfamily B [Eubacterium pyruvativorans]|uniref:ATP-binding cassette, subfamily B n=1 Tax=Eubacterium pyruvativorans TaxID=155865 RepID=A0A1I7FTG1_9FIRM|nr:ABC transporter ATP-binding protein [Eubacterium pyruvativorans]SFN97184.1 ATP-binding cassette, subfamily B [Eubacterium pyruvativorans]SFU39296.1 ATP-binding cassette, subfamily B [Eubacterium pyruvativorans]